MHWDLKSATDQLHKLPHFRSYLVGLERESLRLDRNGIFAKTPHPRTLGAPLTHAYVTTDFSESQPEITVPPYKTHRGALSRLDKILRFVYEQIDDELLWPYSMPCLLEGKDSVPLAQYGSSKQAKEKEHYREELAKRYGSKMQLISGFHYNFSFSAKFWDEMRKTFPHDMPRDEFISESYLHLTRNFFRYGWLITYLFGASPLVHSSYFTPSHSVPLVSEYATSLRQSHLGYWHQFQKSLAISYASMPTYLDSMTSALITPSPYLSKKVANPNYLQTINEHYAPLRPKCSHLLDESPLTALTNRGIEYVEVRSLDLDPFCPAGIEIDTLEFLHHFLIYCLFKKSPPIDAPLENFHKVATKGRSPNLVLTIEGKTLSVKEWGKLILKEMSFIPMNSNLAKQEHFLDHPENTPSARLLQETMSVPYNAFFVRKAKAFKDYFTKPLLTEKERKHFLDETHRSIEKVNGLEAKESFILDGYEDLELSTQIVIRSAKERMIEVDVLDRKANLIELSHKGHREYVKQATFTSKDSLASFALMENKAVTKTLLFRNNLPTPDVYVCHTKNEALEAYDRFYKQKVVIKPNNTNFGEGVSVLVIENKDRFTKAIHHALSYDHTLLIETFFPGEEYRFLIIGNKMVSVVKRDPANVIGDGKHSIKALTRQKNLDPRSYKHPKQWIRLHSIEKEVLMQRGYTVDSIPKPDEKVYLRHNSNVSTGGDAIEVMQAIHPEYAKKALLAASLVNASICGVDMLITHPKEKPSMTNYTFLELNFNPMLSFHRFPYRGEKRDVGGALLDHLGMI